LSTLKNANTFAAAQAAQKHSQRRWPG